jgi:chaperonin GroEL (HSP60 family)
MVSYLFHINIDLAVDKVADIKSEGEIAKAIKTTIASKQYGNEIFLSRLVAKAVLAVMPKNPSAFNVDNVRVVKIMGGGLEDSDVVKGMVFAREPSGTIPRGPDCRNRQESKEGKGGSILLPHRHQSNGNERHRSPS